jgi:predicted alpha/beta-hydrolase family hydrolase
LKDVQVPMLFLQGTRDDLADLKKLKPIVRKLGGRATLKLCQHADHGFHVLKRSGRTDAEVLTELADAFVAWADAI